MAATLRASMAWLHIWAGVVLGALLFAIFWMGTLTVFDREIYRWMMPDTRFAPPLARVSLDRVSEATREIVPEDARHWQVRLPAPASSSRSIKACICDGAASATGWSGWVAALATFHLAHRRIAARPAQDTLKAAE